jgi:hypothetical protein
MTKVTVAFRNFADAPKNTNRSTDKYKINKRAFNCNDTLLDIILRFCLCITASHVVNPEPWLRRWVSGILIRDPIWISGQGGTDLGYFLTVFRVSHVSTISYFTCQYHSVFHMSVPFRISHVSTILYFTCQYHSVFRMSVPFHQCPIIIHIFNTHIIYS